MNKIEKELVAVPGTVIGTPTGGEISIKERVDAFTDLQQARFYSIYHIYGVIALAIVDYFTPRKLKGVWEKFVETSYEVNESDDETRALDEAVTNEFILNQQYTNYDIITTIIKVRKTIGLDPLDGNIPKACLELFNRLFLSTEAQAKNSDGKSKHLVYTPVVAVLVII